MLILGIESSCDESAVALVEDGKRVVASLVASQVDLHARFGGVVPEIAARQHLLALPNLYQSVLRETGKDLASIDGIAVTQGPGLIGAVLVGVAFAKGLAFSSGLPLIPVDHVHAHVHGALLGCDVDLEFPCLALVVSGGHTNLYYMNGPTDFQICASTIDDACGECFDKVGKLLGLPFPGGPAIERLAVEGEPVMPMPKIMEGGGMAFSYSGLKTHMARLIADRRKNTGELARGEIADICASFQEEALMQLIRKLQAACVGQPAVKQVIVAGGVAANRRFRQLVAEYVRPIGIFPEQRFCSDNAAMIGALGYHEFLRKAGDFYNTHFPWDAYSRYSCNR